MTSSPGLNLLDVSKAQKSWISLILAGRPDFIKAPSQTPKGLYCAFESYQDLANSLIGENENPILIEIGHPFLHKLSPKTKHSISRDPDLWESEISALPKESYVLMLAPIDPRDGFCIDKNFAEKLIKIFGEYHPKAHILIIDDLSTFAWSADESPVRYSSIESAQVHWTVRLTELGVDEEFPIWTRTPHPERTFKTLPKQLIQSSDTLLAMLFNREIQKGILYLRRSTQSKRRFRRLADAVNPIVKKGYASLSNWPYSGLNFFVVFNKEYIHSTELLAKQALNTGLKLMWYPQQNAFSVNIAINSKDFADAPERLKNWLNQLAP